VNGIERLFFRYNMELLILGFAFFIAIVLSMFDPGYSLNGKIWSLVFGIPLLIVIMYCGKTNFLPEKKGIYINLLWIPLSLLACTFIMAIIRSGIRNSERYHIIPTIIMVVILWIVLMNVIDYQRYLNANKEMDEIKTVRRFFSDKIELWILSLTYYLAFDSYIAYIGYDHAYISILIIVFAALPILCIDIINSLRGTKIVCLFYSFLITPFALYLVIQKYINIYNTGIRNYTFCILAGLVIIANIILYRNYLYLKYKDELRVPLFNFR